MTPGEHDPVARLPFPCFPTESPEVYPASFDVVVRAGGGFVTDVALSGENVVHEAKLSAGASSDHGPPAPLQEQAARLVDAVVYEIDELPSVEVTDWGLRAIGPNFDQFEEVSGMPVKVGYGPNYVLRILLGHTEQVLFDELLTAFQELDATLEDRHLASTLIKLRAWFRGKGYADKWLEEVRMHDGSHKRFVQVLGAYGISLVRPIKPEPAEPIADPPSQPPDPPQTASRSTVVKKTTKSNKPTRKSVPPPSPSPPSVHQPPAPQKLVTPARVTDAPVEQIYLTPKEVRLEVWREYASCLGIDPDLFFPERGGSTRKAKEICRGCVVRECCLEYALSNGEKFGIWGGMSERERRRVRKQRRMAARLRGEMGPDDPDDDIDDEAD